MRGWGSGRCEERPGIMNHSLKHIVDPGRLVLQGVGGPGFAIQRVIGKSGSSRHGIARVLPVIWLSPEMTGRCRHCDYNQSLDLVDRCIRFRANRGIA